MQIPQSWRIYLDTCCLNRLFDPQIQLRIRQETEAIDTILARVDTARWSWIASSVLEFEIIQNPDLERRANLEDLLRFAHETVLVDTAEIVRSEYLESLGFKHYDALHIACAEGGGADVLLTTDDKLLNRAIHFRSRLHVRVENPHTWLREGT
jgi:predicted nucleic acid-binding protein